MLKVGITGGIGSGKSTVCQIFQSLGIAVFNADSETKQLYTNSKPLQKKLKEAFGSSVFTEEGEVNKPFLRGILDQQQSREKLNAIVHPFVFQRFEDWSEQQISPYVLKEAAILFESGADKTVQKSILVTAPKGLRITRVQSRDQRTKEQIESIMESQWSEEELKKRCDYLLVNDGSEPLIKQVRKLHQELLNQARHF